jgi:hypothetical protein
VEKKYAFIDPAKGTLAVTEDGKIAKKSLNFYERCCRAIFGCCSCYANTRLSLVGAAARKALFDPSSPIQDKQELIRIANLHFHPEFKPSGEISDGLFLGKEKLDNGDTVKYQAFFAPSFYSEKSAVANPHIRITLFRQGGWFGGEEWIDTIRFEFSKHTQIPYHSENMLNNEPKQINVKIINEVHDKSTLGGVKRAFLENLVTNSKVDQILLKLNSMEKYSKSETYEPILKTPISLDFLLLNDPGDPSDLENEYSSGASSPTSIAAYNEDLQPLLPSK